VNEGPLPEYENAKLLGMAVHFEHLKRLLIRWIVWSYITFFQFEKVYFRAVLSILSPGIERWLPKAGRSIRKWVIEAWQERKEVLKMELQEAPCSLRWTSRLWNTLQNVVFHPREDINTIDSMKSPFQRSRAYIQVIEWVVRLAT
jgi:hypothetical protein